MESLVTDDPPLGHSMPQTRFEHRTSKFKCWPLPVQQSARWFFFIYNKKRTSLLAKHYIDDETDEESVSAAQSLIK